MGLKRARAGLSRNRVAECDGIDCRAGSRELRPAVAVFGSAGARALPKSAFGVGESASRVRDPVVFATSM